MKVLNPGGGKGRYADEIIDIVSNDDSISQKEIATRVGISQSAVKRIMSELQKEGLIERRGTRRSSTWIVNS